MYKKDGNGYKVVARNGETPKPKKNIYNRGIVTSSEEFKKKSEDTKSAVSKAKELNRGMLPDKKIKIGKSKTLLDTKKDIFVGSDKLFKSPEQAHKPRKTASGIESKRNVAVTASTDALCISVLIHNKEYRDNTGRYATWNSIEESFKVLSMVAGKPVIRDLFYTKELEYNTELNFFPVKELEDTYE
jgi:hypothetical protein